MTKPRIESLHIYPVKSLAGIEVEQLEFDKFGARFDRRWMIIDQTGKCITQREIPAMALIKPSLSTSELQLSFNHHQFNLDLDADKHPVKAQVWKYQANMLDCGNLVGEFLSDILQTRCRLVTINDNHDRLSGGQQPQPIALVDSRQLLVASQESLEWLNQKLADYNAPPIKMNRFRANIIVSGGNSTFYENNWRQITADEIQLVRQKACGRCKMIVTDQESGKLDNNLPLRILAQFNRDDDGKAAAFGTYFNALTDHGILYRTSKLEIQERQITH